MAGQINTTTAGLQPAAWIFKQMGTDFEDKRVETWPLMSSPWPTLGLTLVYLVICWQGPKFMANRKPWDLKGFIIAYNLALTLLSVYMVIENISVTILNPKFDNLLCAPVDYSNDGNSARLLSVLWLYYASKLLEFVETFVFILRKKNSQISFLHVYHHSSMFVLWWLTVKHCGGGSAYFPVLMNSIIHSFMYTYYMLSAMGESVRKHLWWKRYLTQMQLAQFWIVTFHISVTIYKGCGYPAGYAWALVLYLITQKALFMNFYLKTYRKKQEILKNNDVLKED